MPRQAMVHAVVGRQFVLRSPLVSEICGYLALIPFSEPQMLAITTGLILASVIFLFLDDIDNAFVPFSLATFVFIISSLRAWCYE